MVASDEEMTAGDEEVLDALYGDEGGALDEAQRATLADWRAVRGVVRHAREQGFDAEPPAAGTRGSMEMLMAAARAQAPERAGLWARLRGWLATMVAHPAMAGAAALVVVGGAAGVLYLKGKSEVARPPASPTWTGLAKPAAPATGVGEDERAEGEERAADRATPVTDGVGSGSGSGSPDVGAGSGSASTLSVTSGTDGVAPTGRGPRPRGTATESRPKPKASDTTTPGGVARGPVSGEGQSPEAVVNEDVEGDKNKPMDGVPESPPTSPPPPPPPPPLEAGTTTRPPARPAQIAVDDEQVAANRASAVRLTTQARTAAKAGDCAKVDALSKQVLALDAGYHRDVFVRDPDIAKCR